MDLYGRSEIFTDAEEIDRSNVIEILSAAVKTHEQNVQQINYLYDYYRGKQPILDRQKTVRPEINNTVVENRANEIVSFKVGFLLDEPIQYVSRTADDGITEAIATLNQYRFCTDMDSKDKEIADWITICGQGYRMVLPAAEYEEGEPPYEVFTLDPRSTFVIKSSQVGNKPMMGVTYVKRADQTVVYTCYTKDRQFTITNAETIDDEAVNPVGEILITEYQSNTARQGEFEIVCPLLDALNMALSDRMNATEQFVQALLMLKGVDIDAETFLELKDLGGIKVPPDGDVKYLVQELNQTQQQTLVDYIYSAILTICGMPNRNGGYSTSDTGKAVILRDGFSAAQGRAKNTELLWKRSEKNFLRAVLKICAQYTDMELTVSQIDIRFPRKNYENIGEKVNVLTQLLNNGQVHPQLAFDVCQLFPDSQAAYLMSRAYEEERTRADMALLDEENNRAAAEEKAVIDENTADEGYAEEEAEEVA